MFTIKADIIRIAVSLVLLNLDHWVFTTVGAILILLASLNLVVHFFFPHLMPKEADIFPKQTFASLVQEDQASAPPRTTH